MEEDLCNDKGHNGDPELQKQYSSSLHQVKWYKLYDIKYSVNCLELFNVTNVFISHFDLYYEIQPKLHLWNYIKSVWTVTPYEVSKLSMCAMYKIILKHVPSFTPLSWGISQERFCCCGSCFCCCWLILSGIMILNCWRQKLSTTSRWV